MFGDGLSLTLELTNVASVPGQRAPGTLHLPTTGIAGLHCNAWPGSLSVGARHGAQVPRHVRQALYQQSPFPSPGNKGFLRRTNMS